MSSSILQCPACGRVLYFSHRETNVLVCNCTEVIKRDLSGKLSLSTVKIIPDPSEVIQPGTNGIWEGKTFKVTGRFRAWFEESVFNYWTILFNDGELAYLGEGYGLYSIMKKTNAYEGNAANFVRTANIGSKRELNRKQYLVEKNFKCSKLEVEGELYIPEYNIPFELFELSDGNGHELAFFEFRSGNVVPFEAFYVPFSSLSFTNTRNVSPPPKLTNCNNCKRPMEVRAFPYSQSYACKHCGSHHEFRTNNFRSTGDRNSISDGTEITLGSTGVIKNITYEVIGFALKEEKNQERSRWREYTLYNKQEGYAFLSEYNGHWIYVREQASAPVMLGGATQQTLIYKAETFVLFNRYGYEIINASGEFPYNIFNPEGTDVREFISPPEVWIQENNKREGITWFLGEYIDGKDLENNFDFPAGVPLKSGIGAVEPKLYISTPKLVMMALAAMFVLMVIHLVIDATKQKRPVIDEIFRFPDSVTTYTRVTEKFKLDKWRSNLEFEIQAPVDNDWFELGINLVNAQTGTEYTLSKGVEYYHGYSDGESWSEGDRRETAYLSQIPAGTYFLQITGIRSSSFSLMDTYRLKVTYDVSNDRNMFFSILLVLIWPVIQYYRIQNIEKLRWSNSPFSNE
ncbi:MAG TPA: DUF4178 domain-containing protein [Chitinophagaceae bacterium]